MMKPPTNWATANCQPNKTTITTPISITKLVEANMKTLTATKSAPFTKSDLDMAVAAYEHDDESIPKAVARPTAGRWWSPNLARIGSRLTKAWTAPESPKPKMSGQSVTQNMKKASRSDRPMSMSTIGIAT